MNYVLICPECSHEHLLVLEIPNGNLSLKDMHIVPDNCHECGKEFDWMDTVNDIKQTFNFRKSNL